MVNKIAASEKRKKRKIKKVSENCPVKKKKQLKADDLATLDADDFMAAIGDGSDQEDNLKTLSKPKLQKKKKGKSKSISISDQVPGNSEQKPEPKMNIPGSNSVKKGLSNLEDKDSDFFKFLQENDPDLLDFNEEDSDNSESESEGEAEPLVPEPEVAGDDDGEGDAAEEPATEVSTSTAIPVTAALLRTWAKALQRNSLPTWKQLIRAFQAAVVSAKGDEPEGMKYSIIDPDMVNKVIMLCLGHSTDLLKHHLGDNPTSSPKWSKLKMSLKSYLSSLTELLGLLTSDDVLCAVMRHSKTMLPYFVAFSRLIKRYVKSHICVWGSKTELSRVVAFTCLQAVIKKVPTFLEEVLKKMYVEYTRCSKAMSPKSRDVIILMRNCLVELCRVNPSVTYTAGFLYIRQLAVTLRSVTTHKKEVESVYNWQYVNCLHVWVAVLSDCDACLQPLIFPLIQVMQGVIKLQSSPCFYPLHLHVIRMLLHLSECTNKHIPLIHPLLEILDFCSSTIRVRATKPIDLTCVLRVTKGYKKTKSYQDGVFDLTYELILNYSSQLSKSISFPEVSFPVTVWLRKFNKKCDNSKYSSQIKQVIEKIEVVSRDLTDRRSHVTFTPRDLDQVTAWEEGLPESALTKYFNNWLKVHRAVQAANKEAPDSEEGGLGEGGSEEEAHQSSEEVETVKMPKKSGKQVKKTKSKTKIEVNGKDKKSKGKKKLKMAEENVDFVDKGDLVEDIVLSD